MTADGWDRAGSAQGPKVAFVLGKPPRADSALPEVVTLMRLLPANVAIHLPKGKGPMPEWLFESHLVVQRGLGQEELAAAQSLEDAGLRCCNSVAATIVVADRRQVTDTLSSAGLPVPATATVSRWPDVVAHANERPVVVKAAGGAVGRGEGVLMSSPDGLPLDAPFEGPYVVQDLIRNDGRDRKLYVAGQAVRGLLKPWPPQSGNRRGEPFTVRAELTRLALRAGSVLGLDVYGIDFIEGPDGPVIVDVNPFPGFRSIPQGAQLIAAHLRTLLQTPV